jgi:AcrR family transcriptional regulator
MAMSPKPQEAPLPPGAPGEPHGKLSPGPGLPAPEVAEHQLARIHSAMVEIVAAHGYDAVKVREVVKLAGVSSRAFYEHFDSKEDCFLRTHLFVTQGAAGRMRDSQVSEADWRERPRLIYAAFASEMAGAPRAARFAMVDAYAAGPMALEQAQRIEGGFETMLGESFARAPDGVVVPAMVVEGIVAGIGRVARTRLLAGLEADLPGLGPELIVWALGYPGKPAMELAGLDKGLVLGDTTSEPLDSPSQTGGEIWPPSGDRDVILASVGKLVVADGYDGLTVRRIRAGAGVSRAVFDAHFEGVEDSFLGALEQRAGEALAQAVRAQEAGSTWSGGIYRAIAALCGKIAADSLLAGVCLTNNFATESSGSHTRQRLIAAVAEQIADSAPLDKRTSDLVAEASAGAIWGLFHHYAARDWVLNGPQIAATLSFMALAPAIGAQAAVVAIRSEQAA